MIRLVAVICFFLSGASGLIFQVIWARYFSHVLGTTTLAISTVLTAFMGGLGVGSYLASRIADRVRKPLHTYALLELGIGFCALALPSVIDAAERIFATLYPHLHTHYALLALTRFLVSAPIILIPTTLMGMTLPILSRYFVQTTAEHHRIGIRVGTLYAINTWGAVLGTLLGGLALLPQLGLTMTNQIAASVNFALALLIGIASWIARRHPSRLIDDEIAALYEEVQKTIAQKVVITDRARRWTLIAFAISGATAMIYQVLWSRALSLVIGSSIYSFTIVLVAFLIGLSGGAAVLGRVTHHRPSPVRDLALLHAMTGLFAVGSSVLVNQLNSLFLWLMHGQSFTASSFMWVHFVLAIVVILPATFLMGGVFPLTLRICSSDIASVGHDVGKTYAVNTVGAIIGSFLAGFVIIPWLQLQPGILFTATISFLLAALLFNATIASPRRKLVVVSSLFAVIIGTFLLPSWNLTRLSGGFFRPSIARTALAQGDYHQPKLVYYRDGISTTVTVEQWSKEHFSLKNNGKVDASTGDDMPTQILVGILPLLVHEQAPQYRPDVALVGYASGVTAGSILQFPVKTLDVIELEPAILTAAAYFSHVNHRPLDDPRTRVYTDDGRNFLAFTPKRYDVIINEPSNPWIAGVSNLFTRDYFTRAKTRLKPGGIFCSWAQLYELSPRRIKAIYQAFASSFPYVYVFSAHSYSTDTFLIGSETPLTLNLDRLKQAFAMPKLRAELHRAEVHQPDDLVSRLLFAPHELHAFLIGATANTDDNALIEFGAPLDLYNDHRNPYLTSVIYSRNWLYGDIGTFIRDYRHSDDLSRLIRSLLAHGKIDSAIELAEQLDTATDRHSLKTLALVEIIEPKNPRDTEFTVVEEGAPELTPPDRVLENEPETKLNPARIVDIASDYRKMLKHLQQRTYCNALGIVEDWPELYQKHAGADFHLLWGALLYRCGESSAAATILERIATDDFIRRRPIVLYYLGLAQYDSWEYPKGIKALLRWIDLKHPSENAIVTDSVTAP